MIVYKESIFFTFLILLMLKSEQAYCQLENRADGKQPEHQCYPSLSLLPVPRVGHNISQLFPPIPWLLPNECLHQHNLHLWKCCGLNDIVLQGLLKYENQAHTSLLQV